MMGGNQDLLENSGIYSGGRTNFILRAFLGQVSTHTPQPIHSSTLVEACFLPDFNSFIVMALTGHFLMQIPQPAAFLWIILNHKATFFIWDLTEQWFSVRGSHKSAQQSVQQEHSISGMLFEFPVRLTTGNLSTSLSNAITSS